MALNALNPFLSDEKSLDITPDPSTLPKFGKIRTTIEDAIAELIDNSIDALKGDRVDIFVDFGNRENPVEEQYLKIEDNGTGMTLRQAQDALVLGKTSKPGTDAIGAYGFGLKRAVTFLGRRVTIYTTTAEDEDMNVIVYDEEEFTRNNKWEVRAYSAPKKFPHGTLIHVEKLNVNLGGHGAGRRIGHTPIERLETLLGRQHRSRLTQDVFIEINRRTVQPLMPEWDSQYDPIRTNFDFEVKGVRVYGFVGVGQQVEKIQGDFGFDLVRHRRVVKTAEKIGFADHPTYRNIYGVINMDKFPVTNDKTDFVRDSDEWLEFETKMAEVVEPILRVIRKWGGSGLDAPVKNQKIKHLFRLIEEEQQDGTKTWEWRYPGHELDPISHRAGHPIWREIASEITESEAGTTPASDEPDGISDPFPEDDEDADDGHPDKEQAGSTNTPSLNPTVSAGALPNPILNRPAPESEFLPAGAGRAQLLEIFSGEVAGIRFQHQTVNAGAGVRYQKSELDTDGVLVVSTNRDHILYPKYSPFRAIEMWFVHNVAEAITEHLEKPARDFVDFKIEVLEDVKEALEAYRESTLSDIK